MRIPHRGRVAAVLSTALLVSCSADPGSSTPAPSVPSTSAAVATTVAPTTSATLVPATSTPPPTDSAGATDPGPCGGVVCYDSPAALPGIPAAAGTETSGIAVSSVDPSAFFVLDDATGTTGVSVIRDGELLGFVEAEGLSAENAEALATGICPEDLPSATGRCLYLGDIGDHIGRHGVVVSVVAEPNPSALQGEVAASMNWSYAYPDGPTDAEAMLVDAEGAVIIISKPAQDSADEHVVYRGRPGGGDLERVRSFVPPEPEKPLQSLLVGNRVTDATQVPGRVLLITYDQALEFTAPTPDADPALFADWPYRSVPMPLLTQAEAVAYLPGGCGYVVAAEGGGLARVATESPCGT